MSDLLVLALCAGAGVVASTVTGLLSRHAARRPLLARLAEVEAQRAADAHGAKRREAEAARRHGQAERRLLRALGLPDATDDIAAPAGRALAEIVVERLRGLATVDACVVADELGLAWTADDVEGADALAAAASVAFATTLRGASPRSLHVELEDARHIVVRPLPGTLPVLALATLATSRPTSAFALDAAIAHASLLVGAPDEADDRGSIGGWSYRVSRPDAPVTGLLADEVQLAAGELSCGAMALLVGDEIVAAHATDGPREEDLASFAISLRSALVRVGTRFGTQALRLDWTASDGSTLSIAPLGSSGRTAVMVVRRGGPVEGRAFERLGGRLRRLLPAEASSRRDEARP